MSRKTLMGIFVALLSIATGASAATISSHGAAFVAYNAGEANTVDYVAGGVRTTKTSSQSLIASVPRNTISAGSQTYVVTGWHNGVQTTGCSVLAGLSDGSFFTSKDASANNVSGAWSRSASMTAAEVPSNTRVAVLCSVPANSMGVLAGVTANP